MDPVYPTGAAILVWAAWRLSRLWRVVRDSTPPTSSVSADERTQHLLASWRAEQIAEKDVQHVPADLAAGADRPPVVRNRQS